MMTLEQIRERNRKENAAARRLQAAGYRLEGWDPRTGQRIDLHRLAYDLKSCQWSQTDIDIITRTLAACGLDC